MASAEKVDARGLVYLSRFLLRLLEKLDDELVQPVSYTHLDVYKRQEKKKMVFVGLPTVISFVLFMA